MNYWTESKKNIYVAAHRGWCEKYPENTMIAFQKAVELGVDQIETDVRVTVDGELVLIHDSKVDRTTNGTGYVREKSLEELCRLDAGSWKDKKFCGCRIPTLLELMELVKDHPTITLDFELKEYPIDGREEIAYDVCDRLLAIVDQYGFTDRVVINSFSGKLNEYVRKKYGNTYRQHVFFPVSHLGKGMTMDPYDYAFCCCMFRTWHSEVNISSKHDFDEMWKRGVEPWAGSAVCDEQSLDLAIENGAALITCNNPDVILDLLRKKGYHS